MDAIFPAYLFKHSAWFFSNLSAHFLCSHRSPSPCSPISMHAFFSNQSARFLCSHRSPLPYSTNQHACFFLTNQHAFFILVDHHHPIQPISMLAFFLTNQHACFFLTNQHPFFVLVDHHHPKLDLILFHQDKI
jgi:hypothetical protein